MGIETIVGAIAAEARAATERLRAENDARVAAIREEAERKADDERNRWAHSRDGEAQIQRDRIVNRQRLAADRELANAREEWFQEAIRRLDRRLDVMVEGSDYGDVLAGFYDEAFEVIPDRGGVVRVRPSDDGLIRRVIADRHDSAVPIEHFECRGGLDIEMPDGRAVRNTLEARLVRAERSFRQLAVRVIPGLATGGEP